MEVYMSELRESRIPKELEALWRERLFNATKLSRALLSADAVLTWAFLLWVLYVGVVVCRYAWSPRVNPLHYELGWSLSIFFAYYALIGFVRRQTQKYEIRLRSECQACIPETGSVLMGERVYREDDDPLVARIAFRARDVLWLPRRGLGQSCVVLAQFIFGLLYIVNDIRHTYWDATVSFPDRMWVLHGLMTVGGVLILMKNAGFLIEVRQLLRVFEDLLGLAPKLPRL
jgi:hypothetical protein